MAELSTNICTQNCDFHHKTPDRSEAAKPSAVSMSDALRFSDPSEASSLFLFDKENMKEEEVSLKIGCKNKAQKMKLMKEKVQSENLKEEVPQIARNVKFFTLDYSKNKPYACNMTGCDKRYKNRNGVKYHLKVFHNITYIPTLKNSLLKQHEVSSNSKSNMELESQEIPQYKQPIQKNVAYPNMHSNVLVSQVQLGSDKQVHLENDNPVSFDNEAGA